MNTEAFVSILLIGLLSYLILVPWREVMTAYARQIVFERRDALFDMALAGKLDFASSEYRTIRKSLEASIRFAHELTLSRMLVFRVATTLVPRGKTESEMMIAVREIADEATRSEVLQLVVDAQKALIIMMILKSPILTILSLILFLVALCGKGVRTSLDMLAKQVGELVQIEAETVHVVSPK